MEREPSLVTSTLSRQIVEDGIPFGIEIYKLEGQPQWRLEVDMEDGSVIVWDEHFDSDLAALNAAISEIKSQGARTFLNGGSNMAPFAS